MILVNGGKISLISLVQVGIESLSEAARALLVPELLPLPGHQDRLPFGGLSRQGWGRLQADLPHNTVAYSKGPLGHVGGNKIFMGCLPGTLRGA